MYQLSKCLEFSKWVIKFQFISSTLPDNRKKKRVFKGFPGLGGMEPVMGDESSPSDPLAPAPLGGVKPPVPTSRESEPAPVKRRGKLLVVAHVLTVVVSVVLSLVLGPMFLSNEETGNGETTSASSAEDGNGKLREEVDLLGESLEEVTAAVAQLDDRLTAASGGNKAVDELATDLEAVKAAVDQIDGRLAAVNNTNQELADQLALLDISKDSNASALTSFENSRRDEDGNMVFINYPDEYILNSADYQFLREMPHLEELYLSGNQVKDSALKFLKGIRNLKTLDLSENPITNSGLADLADFPNLESISLRETAITDAGLVHLKGMENLKSLSLRDTAITNAGVAQLQKALPDCEITNP